MELSEMAIGIANLPNQIHRRSVIKGFDFNLLVVGDSGLGKSTFLNMLFQSNLYTESPYDHYENSVISSPIFNSSLITLVENAVKLKMELIELNDIDWSIDNQEKWDEVVSYITSRLQQYLDNEDSSVLAANDDRTIRDSRIHSCLYFIPPTGHRLRSVDVKFLKTVGKWVNVIPLIAKADTLTSAELKSFKKRICEDFRFNNIQFYTFPDLNTSEVYQPNMSQVDSINMSTHYNNMPFAVAGSLSCETKEDSSKSYVRIYPWGTVKIEDPKHSDFEIFNNLFLKTHMFHMIFSTKHYIYEKFRRTILLQKLGFTHESSEEFNDEQMLSSSDISLLAHEVMDLGITSKKESEHLKQLKNDLDQEYNTQAEAYAKIAEDALNSYKLVYATNEKELEEETKNMSQLSRQNSKGEKKKTLLKSLKKQK